MDERRRWFLRVLGTGSVFVAFLAQVAAAARAIFPNVLYEPLKRFKIKRPQEYPQGYTFDPDRRLFVVRSGDSFHVISAVCTHLGCNIQWREKEFQCPCHGSYFAADGEVISGPAPRALPWFPIALTPDGRLEVDSATQVASGFRFTLPKAKA